MRLGEVGWPGAPTGRVCRIGYSPNQSQFTSRTAHLSGLGRLRSSELLSRISAPIKTMTAAAMTATPPPASASAASWPTGGLRSPSRAFDSEN